MVDDGRPAMRCRTPVDGVLLAACLAPREDASEASARSGGKGAAEGRALDFVEKMLTGQSAATCPETRQERRNPGEEHSRSGSQRQCGTRRPRAWWHSGSFGSAY